MSNEIPQLDRAFAQLVADAMQPHLKRAVDEAVHEYMGQNGSQHREDHAEIAEQRKVREREAKARLEAEEETRREAKVEAAERKRFRRVVMSGVIVAVVGLCLNVLGKFFGWY